MVFAVFARVSILVIPVFFSLVAVARLGAQSIAISVLFFSLSIAVSAALAAVSISDMVVAFVVAHFAAVSSVLTLFFAPVALLFRSAFSLVL